VDATVSAADRNEVKFQDLAAAAESGLSELIIEKTLGARIPRESTCCDRVITRVTLERRAAHARYHVDRANRPKRNPAPRRRRQDRRCGRVGLRRESESDTDTVIVIGAATAAPSRGRPTAMSRKHVPFALFLALMIAGCASSTSHATSPGMFGDVDLSSGGRWYLIDLDGDRASVLDGIDAIRAARDRITFKPDPRGAGIVAHGPVGALHLVHDGRIVWSAQAFRPGDISLGTTSANFVPLASCPVTLRRRGEDRYLQSFRAGQIFIDGLPDLPYD
jgi:hypothetical protein